FELRTELGGLAPQLRIRERLDLRLHLVDGRHERQHLLHFALVSTAENLGQNRVDHRILARVRGSSVDRVRAAAPTTESLAERFRRAVPAAGGYDEPPEASSRM